MIHQFKWITVGFKKGKIFLLIGKQKIKKTTIPKFTISKGSHKILNH